MTASHNGAVRRSKIEVWSKNILTRPGWPVSDCANRLINAQEVERKAGGAKAKPSDALGFRRPHTGSAG